MFYSQITINSDINNLSDVEEFIDEIMDKYNIDNQYYGIINVPLIESVKNAIVHGNENNINKKVQISMQIKQSGLFFSVSDEGKGFDYENIMSKNVEQIKTKGLAKIKMLCQDISFENKGAFISYFVNVPIKNTQIQSRQKAFLKEKNKQKILALKNKTI